jgi:hypothetical protein
MYIENKLANCEAYNELVEFVKVIEEVAKRINAPLYDISYHNSLHPYINIKIPLQFVQVAISDNSEVSIASNGDSWIHDAVFIDPIDTNVRINFIQEASIYNEMTMSLGDYIEQTAFLSLEEYAAKTEHSEE